MKYKYGVGKIIPYEYRLDGLCNLGYPVGTRFKCIRSGYYDYKVGREYELEKNDSGYLDDLYPMRIKGITSNGYSASWEVLYIPDDTKGLPLFDYADGVK
jgi:hypothetical protein